MGKAKRFGCGGRVNCAKSHLERGSRVAAFVTANGAASEEGSIVFVGPRLCLHLLFGSDEKVCVVVFVGCA